MKQKKRNAMKQKNRRIRRFSLLGIVILALIIYELAMLDWVRAVLKVGQQQLYVAIFFSLMAALVLVIADRLMRASNAVAMLTGAIAGQLSSMIAVVIYGVLRPDGIERLLNSLALGVIKIVITTAWGSFLLGGWVCGVVLFIAAKSVSIKLDSSGLPSA